MTAPFVYDGAMNGTVFLAYVEQVLVPALKPGDIVIMDNLPAHKASGAREAIEAAGAELRFLPPYSPDPSGQARGQASTPSKTPLPNSRRSSEPRPNEPSQPYGTPSAISSRPSNQTNVPTTSRPQDMIRFNVHAL